MQQYYFPNLFQNDKIQDLKINPRLIYTTDSGKSSIRLLLKSLNLQPYTKIGVPAYTCEIVKDVILNENLVPYYFDLIKPSSFHSDYNFKEILSQNIKVVILTHLYGLIHPLTKEIETFCCQHSIFIIHDAAQSYGVKELDFQSRQNVFYSFGPGKSSTAGHGSLILGIDKVFYNKEVKSLKWKLITRIIINENAKFFIKSRAYGYKLKFWDVFRYKLANCLIPLKGIGAVYPMTNYQKKAASYAIEKVFEKNENRYERAKIIIDQLHEHQEIQVVNKSINTVYFKIVLYITTDIHTFIKYLINSRIPFFRYFDEKILKNEIYTNLQIFKAHGNKFIEISTEATIPIYEIRRVATALNNYKYADIKF